jgi:hypothetical protein
LTAGDGRVPAAPAPATPDGPAAVVPTGAVRAATLAFDPEGKTAVSTEFGSLPLDVVAVPRVDWLVASEGYHHDGTSSMSPPLDVVPGA